MIKVNISLFKTDAFAPSMVCQLFEHAMRRKNALATIHCFVAFIQLALFSHNDVKGLHVVLHGFKTLVIIELYQVLEFFFVVGRFFLLLK